MKNILITGTSGYVGTQIIEKIRSNKFLEADKIGNIIALDVRDNGERVDNVDYYFEDIRNLDKLREIFKKYSINTVVHMAAILAPSKSISVEMMYEVNVEGTRNLLKCCFENNVERFISASSGAAYGYYKDNSPWLDEKKDPIRGNLEFPYSFHKRINEEDFSLYRQMMPQMKQFTFRIGTVLGVNVNNLITDLFKKKVITGIQGSLTPFVFIWDEDLVDIIIQALFSEKDGIYNVAGDGALNLPEIATYLNKRFLALPASFVKKSLSIMKSLGVSQYGPEQIKFLMYRPVLSNKRLKAEFGYTPRKTSLEVFKFYLEKRKFN